MGVLKPWLILILPIASRLRPAPSRCHTQFGVEIVNPAAGTRVARRPAARHARPARDFVLSSELVGHARGHDVLESALKIGAVAQVDGVFHAGVDNPVMPSRRGGSDANDIHNDVRLASAAVASDANARLHVRMGAALGKRAVAVTTTSRSRAFPNMTSKGGLLCPHYLHC